MRGGYRIVDFGGVALTSGEVANVNGVYDSAKNEKDKATLVSGLVVNDTVYPDFYAVFTGESNTYTATVAINGDTITIVAVPGDDVTVTVA